MTVADGRVRFDRHTPNPREPDRIHADPLPFKLDVPAKGSAAAGLAGRTQVLAVPDGCLVAFNAGEFGAGVRWFSSDAEHRKHLGSEHVVRLIDTAAGPLGFVGFSHLSASEGGVLRFTRDANRRWVSKVFANLKSASAVWKESDGSVLVASSEGVERVRMDGQVEPLYSADWGLASPQTIAASPDGTIYVGMQRAIARLTPTGHTLREEWLVDANCAHLHASIDRVAECECGAASGP